jgi:hypothetical protein
MSEPIIAGRKEIRVSGTSPLGLGARYDEITECNGRQIRPQDAEFLEFLVGPALHQQRNEIADPAASEPRISVLHYNGDVIVRKSCVFLSESPLNIANQYALFLRHSDIVAPIPTGVKMPGVNGLLCKSLEKNTFAAKRLRV